MTRTLRHALLALAVPCVAAAQAPDSVRLARIDSIVLANMNARGLVGLSIGLMHDGQIVLERAYGVADRASDLKVNLDTRFAIGSVTKQFIAAIVVQLAQEGRLSLDDKVAKWYPTLTRAGDITLRDLLGHVAGYPDYYPLDFVDRRMLAPIAEDSLIRWYGRLPLDFEPGNRWSYSDTGFIIAGRVAERVTGRPMGRLLRERIFRPLGMAHSSYEPVPLLDSGYAQGYSSFALGEMESAAPEGRGWIAAAGGIWSTPGDLLRWSKALMEGRVVRADLHQR